MQPLDSILLLINHWPMVPAGYPAVPTINCRSELDLPQTFEMSYRRGCVLLSLFF